jgi:raffinose/stachyose/melibiose transport system substrate-binding protein
MIAVSATACAPADSPSGGTTTITWWSWNPDNTTVKPYLEAFEKANPDIDVEFRNTTYADYVQALQLALTSGSGPDVFGMQEGALAQQFAPLAEDLAPYAEKSFGSDWRSLFNSVDPLVIDDKQVGIPWDVLGAGNLWYNKGLFDSLGITYPTDLASWKKVCATLEGAGYSCLQHGAKDAWQNLDLIQTIANQVQPGYFYDAIAGDEKFDSPQMIAALDAFGKLFSEGIVEDGALGVAAYPDSADVFMQGKAGMILFGTWANNYTSTAALGTFAEQYGDPAIADQVFLPAAFPAVVPDATTGTLFGGPDVVWGMSSSSKNKDAAWRLIEFLSGSEEGQTIMGKTLNPPALKSVSIDYSQVKSDAQRSALEEQAQALNESVGNREIANADVKEALSYALAAVAAGTQSPEDAAAAVQQAIDAAG